MAKDQFEKPVIMTITGDVGSGKSLLANALVQRFEADRYSTGTVQRRLAEKMGITTLELNKQAETDPSIDEKIDSIFKSLTRAPKNLVVDSRMAWHFLPDAFKIKLEVHPLVSAERIWGDTSRIGEGYADLAEARDRLSARKESERQRFKTYYDVDIEDHANYDLVINTTQVIPEAVQEIAAQAIQNKREGHKTYHIWASPQILLPTQGVTDNLPDKQMVETIRNIDTDLDQWRFDLPQCTKWSDGFFTVDQGHGLVASALEARRGLIPISLSLKEGDGTADPALMQAWEDAYEITYKPKP